MFETAMTTSDGKCPEGFAPSNTPFDYYRSTVRGKATYVECLKVKVRQQACMAVRCGAPCMLQVCSL